MLHILVALLQVKGRWQTSAGGGNVDYCMAIRVSYRKLYWGGEGGGSSVLRMKGGHDQMKNRCGFHSKLGYCERVVERFGGEVGELGGEDFLPPPVDETPTMLHRYCVLAVCPDAPPTTRRGSVW